MALTPEERRALEDVILSEERRRLERTLLAPLFDKQRGFIADKRRRKWLKCSRRAGKTTLAPRRILLNALERPGTLSRFFAITRLRAKELIWEDGSESLKKLNYELQLDARFNETELSVRLPNDSVIRLTGADKLGEAQKKVGDKLALAELDEAQLYPDEVLKGICEDIVGPALEDLAGSLELLGTPGVRCTGYWYELTRNEVELRTPGWGGHEWTVLDNPAFPIWAGRADWRLAAREWLSALKAARQWADDHPTYVREYLGRWVNDTGALVYKYDPVRNGFDGTLPPLPPGAFWRYVGGSDLGSRDAFAIVIWAYCTQLRAAYEAFSMSQSGLTTDEWEDAWERVVKMFNPSKIRVDTGGLGSVIIETILKKRQRDVNKIWLPLEAAEKTEKNAHQQLMNADFLAGDLMVNRNGVYAKELAALPKDPDDETKEDERYANHACDGGLYGYRELLLTHFKERPKPEESNEPKTFNVDAYRARLNQQLRKGEQPWWQKSKR